MTRKRHPTPERRPVTPNALLLDFKVVAYSVDQFLEWLPGVTRAQVEALLDYELMALNQLLAS